MTVAAEDIACLHLQGPKVQIRASFELMQFMRRGVGLLEVFVLPGYYAS
jgi:hypothetical protein